MHVLSLKAINQKPINVIYCAAVPKPAHMGAHKHAGQTKTNPPPAHGGIGSQGQIKAHQAAGKS